MRVIQSIVRINFHFPLGFRVSVVDADSWTYLVSEGLPRYFMLVSTLCRVPLLPLSYFVVVFMY